MLQVLPAAPAPTGLSDLGQVLMSGSRDYMNQRRVDRERDTQRKEHLQDIQSQRDYSDQRFNVERQARRDDAVILGDIQMKHAMLQMLVAKGYLAPGDIQNADKIMQAYASAKHDGLVDRYQGLLASGDLKPEDVTNDQAVNAAIAAQGARGKKTITDTATTRDNATAQVADLWDQSKRLETQRAALEQKLSTPVRTQPTEDEVKAEAYKMAKQQRAMNPGTFKSTEPPPKEVAGQMDSARQTLATQIQERAYAEKSAIKEQIILLNNQAQNLKGEIASLQSGFHVAPPASAPVPTHGLTEPTPQPTLRTITPQEQGQHIVAAVGGNVAPNVAGPQSLPGDDPLIAAENQRRAVAFHQQTVVQPLADLDQQIAQNEQAITATRSPSYQRAPVAPTGGDSAVFPMFLDRGVSPSDQAQRLSQLLIQNQQLKAKRAALAAATPQTNPTNPFANPMQAMTPTSSQPMAVSNQVYGGPSSLDLEPAQ